MESKLKVTSIKVENIDPKDPVFRKLDRKFILSCIPFIGRWLGGSYTTVNTEPQGSMYGVYDPDTDTVEYKNPRDF
jgi:hypothetical protein